MSKHDYLLSDARYERFQKLILTRTGLLFGSKRHHALGKGVLAQAQAAANGDLDMYLSLLTDAETDSPLWDALIDALTIGETYFFRDNCQIQALRQHILPLIISEHQHDRKIRIWSAGCASGEEPYTLAMLLSELIFGIDQWNITILATDINKQVLKKGARARYRSWSFRQTDATVQSRYFRYRQGEYQLVQGIRQYVQFAYLNLNEPVYPSLATNTHAMDLILCRNVAIYYSESVIRRVVERFHRCLTPGGWLMMGAAETSIPAFDQYAIRNFSAATVFQKRSSPVTVPVRFDLRLTDEDDDGGYAKPAGNRTLETAVFAEPDTHAPSHSRQPSPADHAGAIDLSDASSNKMCLFERGVRLIQEKQYEAAMEIFQRCIASNPKDADSLYQMARTCANIGKMNRARSFCQQAIDIDPLKTESYYTMALIYQESGDPISAVNLLKRALFLDSRFVLAHFSLALIYRQCDQKDKAVRHRRQAIDLASRVDPETILFGSDDLTARVMLSMLQTFS